MKTIKNLLITVAMLLCSATASAYDFEVDGIYYNIVSLTDLTVEVTSGDNEYSGEVVIPSTVTYKSKVLDVISIAESAFSYDWKLTNVIIGNNVTTIGKRAFYGTGLTEITIPDNVTSIEGAAFYSCSGLKSITIGAGITHFENDAFTGCRSLKELYIQDSEGTIGFGYNTSHYNDFGDPYYLAAFRDCPLENIYLGRNISSSPFEYNTSLKSVIIGNNVTTIGEDLFYGCTGLTEITIPDNVTSIESSAFSGCSGLTNIRLSNNIASIAYATFEGCKSLTSIVIPENVTSIRSWAFSGCSGLEKIYLMCATPPTVAEENYTNAHFLNTTVYVPQGAIEAYQAADVWKEFWDIQEQGATDEPDTETKKCATPVITYNNNGLDITCETDGAEIHTTIECSDADSFNGGRIDLSATYSITTYATKSGYLNSETATATLCWIAISGDSEDNSIIEVEAMPVLITCNNGTINISGGKDGAEVVIYTTSGVAVGNATITNGNATISTELAMGEIAVVNIAGKGIKIVMQ